MMASVMSARSESALCARGHSTLGTMPGTSYRFCVSGRQVHVRPCQTSGLPP